MKALTLRPFAIALAMLLLPTGAALGDCNCQDGYSIDVVGSLLPNFTVEGGGEGPGRRIQPKLQPEAPPTTFTLNFSGPTFEACSYGKINLECGLEYRTSTSGGWIQGRQFQVKVLAGHVLEFTTFQLRVSKGDTATPENEDSSPEGSSIPAQENPPSVEEDGTPVAPGIRIAVPTSLVGLGEDGGAPYRSAGVLTWGGPVSSANLASPDNIAHNVVEEAGPFTAFETISSYPGEKHLTTPTRLFRITGKSTHPTTSYTASTENETYIREYGRVSPSETRSTSLSREPVSWWKVTSLERGVKIEQSVRGRYQVKTYVVSSDSRSLVVDDGITRTTTTTTPPATTSPGHPELAGPYVIETLVERDNVPVSKSLKLYQKRAGEYRLTVETVYPDPTAIQGLATYYGYYTAAAEDKGGQLRWISRPDNSWEVHEYNSAGEHNIYTPFESEVVFDDSTLSEEYLPLQPAPGFLDGARVRRTNSATRDEYVLDLADAGTTPPSGTWVKKGERIFENTVTNRLDTASPTDAILDKDSDDVLIPLVEVGRAISYSQDIAPSSSERWRAGRTILTHEKDGSAQYHEHSKQTDATLGEIVVETITTGFVTEPTSGNVTVGSYLFLTVDNFSERTVSTYGAKGLLKREKLYHTGSSFTSSGVEILSYDAAGKYASTAIDGIVVDSVTWPDGLTKIETDSQGKTTTTKFNDHGEVFWTETAAGGGVPAIRTSYERQGQTTTTKVNGVVTNVVTADGLGRTVSSVDATGAITDTEYDYPSGEGSGTKTVLPGGIEMIDENYLDGSLRSRSGSGQVAEFHSTGTSGQGYIKTESTGSASSHTERQTSTWYDIEDKVIKVVKPSGSGGGNVVVEDYQYSGSFAVGTFSRETDSEGGALIDLPRKLFYPSASAAPDLAHVSGKVRTSGLDLDGDDGLSFAGVGDQKDRYSKQESAYVILNGIVHRKTTEYSYPDQSEATPVITETLESLGFDKQGTDSYRSTRKITSSSANSSRSVTTTTLVTPAAATVVTTEDDSASSFDKVTTEENGYVQSAVSSPDGVLERFSYDDFGRIRKYSDARNAATFSYHDDFQLAQVTDHLRRTISYAYYGPGEKHAGKLKKVTNPGGIEEETSYTDRGEIWKVSGSGAYPVEYGYDAYGNRNKLTTFRSPTEPAVTHWEYQAGTGLLLHKRYNHGQAGSNGIDYEYTADWRPAKRTSAENVVTTYSYESPARDLTGISYVGDNDLTPDVSFSGFDGLGRPTTVSEARSGAGAVGTDPTNTGSYTTTQTLSYQPHSHAVSISYADNHRWLPGAKVLHIADDASGRPKGFELKVGSASGTAISRQEYGYDGFSRLETVSSSELEGVIDYLPGTDKLQRVTTKVKGTGTLVHERKLAVDLLGRTVGVTNRAGSSLETLVASVGHQYDDAGRRANARREDGTHWDYSYNSRSEVTRALKKTPSGPTVPGMDFSYRYDDIGNRKRAWSGEDSSETSPTWEYATNAFNQYTRIDHSGRFDILSRADAAVTPSTATTNASVVSGGPFDQGNLRGARMQLNNASGGKLVTTTLARSGGGSETVKTWVPDDEQAFSYDDDGNLLNDGRWVHTWDGENRLVSMVPTSAALSGGVPNIELRFAYDWMSRRIGKTVVDKTSGPAVYKHVSYAYDHWNPVVEWERSTFLTDGAPVSLAGTGVLKRTHLWGLDIGSSGTAALEGANFQAAGGVAGLAVSTYYHDSGLKDFFVPSYDAIGNVIAWSDSNGILLHRMDFDPYGNTVFSEKIDGATISTNAPSFGFSTKMRDVESGLHYYGARFHSPLTGRWLSRDPLDEDGGINLYSFTSNDAVNGYDILGFKTCRVTVMWAHSAEIRQKLFERNEEARKKKENCSFTSGLGCGLDGRNGALGIPNFPNCGPGAIGTRIPRPGGNKGSRIHENNYNGGFNPPGTDNNSEDLFNRTSAGFARMAEAAWAAAIKHGQELCSKGYRRGCCCEKVIVRFECPQSGSGKDSNKLGDRYNAAASSGYMNGVDVNKTGRPSHDGGPYPDSRTSEEDKDGTRSFPLCGEELILECGYH